MKHCLAIRWGAYGDMMYCLPALERLKRDYGYLHLETGERGKLLFQHNPIFDKITTFNVGNYDPKDHYEVAKIRWGTLEESFKWDKTVNFWRCLEVSCITEDWQESFFYPRERRQEHYSKKNFYDAHLVKAGYDTGLTDGCGTMYFPKDTLQWMRYWRSENTDKFVIAMVLAGSTGQKIPHGMDVFAKKIYDKYKGKDVKFYLLGDKESEQLQFDFGKKNVAKMAGKLGYWQSLALVKMADYVIGPETSLLVGAGLFGTPKTMIATSCGYEQATRYQLNDFSIQSEYPCSPCHRAIYNYQGNASQKYCNLEDSRFGMIPACNLYWNHDKAMKGVDFAYKMRGVRKEVERYEGPGFGSLPDMRTLLP